MLALYPLGMLCIKYNTVKEIFNLLGRGFQGEGGDPNHFENGSENLPLG